MRDYARPEFSRLNAAGSPDLAEWYIYQATGNPAGPFSTDLLAMGVAAGKVSRDAYVARQGDPQWTEIMQVIEVGEAVRDIETAVETGDRPPPSAPINTIPPAPPPLKTEAPTIVLPLFVPGAGEPLAVEPPPPVIMGPPIAKELSARSDERVSHPTWGKAPVSTEKLVASWIVHKPQPEPPRKYRAVVPIIIVVACFIAALVTIGVWRSMSNGEPAPVPASSK